MQTILLPTTRATGPLPFTVVHTAAPNLTRRISPPNRRLSPSFSVSCATFPTPLSPLSANAMTSPLRLLPKTASFVTCASGGFYLPANESEQAKLAQAMMKDQFANYVV